jgi:SpoVK/Ycf46/Vps4 family AAA+-type ATPase
MPRLTFAGTDRPTDIDAAFLRRMPKRFAIRLPDAAQRKSILKLVGLDPSTPSERRAQIERVHSDM